MHLTQYVRTVGHYEVDGVEIEVAVTPSRAGVRVAAVFKCSDMNSPLFGASAGRDLTWDEADALESFRPLGDALAAELKNRVTA